MAREQLAAVVLAGGRGARLGGQLKPLIEVGGMTLLARVVAGARAAGCAEVVVVGPDALRLEGVLVVREEPAFGGPAAGLAAGVAHVEADEVLVLAADLVRGDEVARRLAEVGRAEDGTVLVDETGRHQWVASRWRTDALRAAIAGAADLAGWSLRRLLEPLAAREVAVGAELVCDVDTPSDLARVSRLT